MHAFTSHLCTVIALLLCDSAIHAQTTVVKLSGDVYDGQKGPLGRGVFWVTGSVRVPPGKTLTITEPFGLTVVKFADGTGITVEGSLQVKVGCNFTSIHDDMVGGDTNGNGAGSSPKPGSWNGISWGWSSTDSTLNACTLRYAGNNGRAAISPRGSVG